MQIFTDTPLITKEVLEYLERQYPDRIPKDAKIGIEEVRFLQGQQSVIEKIRQLTEFPEDEET
jgi:pyoverdine/dityrosine biosynthesis protein Dit1